MRAVISTVLLIFLVATAAGEMPANIGVAENGCKYFTDRFVVMMKSGTTLLITNSLVSGQVYTGNDQIDMLCAENGVIKIEPYYPALVRNDNLRALLERLYTFTVISEVDAIDVYGNFSNNKDVESSDLWSVAELFYTPNDPSINQQWALPKVDAFNAWDIMRGDTTATVVIGIDDSGVYYTHPDLADNMWINGLEDINSNGIFDNGDINHIDDDGNGYIDDVIGWDFGFNDNDPAEDQPEHGTHVAGCASEVTDNGIGGAGLGFSARLMAVKASNTPGYITHGYPAMIYAADNGAHIVNCSWGAPGYSGSEQSIINNVYNMGVLVIASAGNDYPWTPPYVNYPSAYNHVLGVAATDQSDHLASFSNYGTWVDVSAPGVSIYSTWATGTYMSLSGTSMSSPVACGLAALIKAQNPSWRPDAIELRMESSAVNIDTLNPQYEGMMGAGRIDAYAALAAAYYPNIQLVDFYVTLISDDGDGVVNPGESIELVVVLQNLWQDAFNVVGTLGAPEGITLIDSVTNFGDIEGNGEVTDNGFDPYSLMFAGDIVPGQYNLTLSITADDDYSTEVYVPVEVTLEMAGFPISLEGAIESHPLIFDFDSDGQNEIIVGTNDNRVYAVESDGLFSPGWPVTGSGDFNTAACVGDLDGDGDFEVVACAKDGHVYAWDESGNVLNGFPVDVGSIQVFASPTLADLDGNGDLEIIQAGFLPSKSIYIINHDGSNFGSWPYVGDDPWYSGVTIGDIDGNDQLEIAIGGLDNKLHVFNIDMTEVEDWPYDVGEDIKVAPAVGNIDPSDPELEIVVGTNGGSVYLFNHDGTIVDGWPVDLGSQIKSTPSLADFDDDGSPEIIIGTSDSELYIYDSDASIFNGFPVTLSASIKASAVVGDISGDGSPDIIIANGSINSLIYAFDSQGQLLENFPMPTAEAGQISATPAIWDIDGDGDMEIVVGVQASGNNLSVIDYKVQASLTDMQWLAFGNDIYRSNNYVPLFPYTDVPDEPVSLPFEFSLNQNFPNPFNSKTVIRFSLDKPGNVSLEVFDILGRKVKTLSDGFKQAGNYEITWNGRNSENTEVASGIYFYRLKTDVNVLVRRMAYLR